MPISGQISLPLGVFLQIHTVEVLCDHPVAAEILYHISVFSSSSPPGEVCLNSAPKADVPPLLPDVPSWFYVGTEIQDKVLRWLKTSPTHLSLKIYVLLSFVLIIWYGLYNLDTFLQLEQPQKRRIRKIFDLDWLFHPLWLYKVFGYGHFST